MNEVATELQAIYTKFRPWVDERRVGKLRPGRFFDCCVRSALSKLFDFNSAIIDITLQDHPIPSFFVAGSLRGSCEDLIVLDFLHSISNEQRDKILVAWTSHEQSSNILTQTPFFEKERPFQPVLKSKDQSNLQKSTAYVQPIWRSLGFNLKPDQIAPSTWALAKKAGISEVYEYFYRFSCDMVHFNPVVLLRFGWADDPSKPRFDASNFNRYYLSFGLVYGAYLWCLYLQFLRKNLRLSTEARAAEKELIGWLKMHERWPEITTHEELNLPDPKHSIFEVMGRIYFAETKKRIFRRKKTSS